MQTNSLIKKELSSFFASFTGYMAIGIFLLATNLFLWVIPGNFNLIDSQQASLKGFFQLAPWLYLFLIPAITMRLFAEEKKTGTLELLRSRPVPLLKIVGVKYLAALILVALSLLPTLIGFLTVWKLGNPPGVMDTGATWGSYLGLLFLASGYIAFGLLASSLTSNQALAFLTAFLLSFLFFMGFQTLLRINPPIGVQGILSELSFNEHFESMSRGVLDSRDLFYFVGLTLLILMLVPPVLRRSFLPMKQGLSLLVLIVVLIFLTQVRLFRADLTAEKRYSLSPVMKEILEQQKGIASIEIYLAGKELPAGMKDFRQAIVEKIEDLNAWSPHRIYYRITDLYAIGNEEERNKQIHTLISAGIQPVQLEHKTTEGLSTRQIFPGALIRMGDQIRVVNLLKNNPSMTPVENLHQSVELLEYEFARAFRLLQESSKARIAFLEGHGEADFYATGDLRYALREKYTMAQTTAEQLNDDDSTQILLVADPQEKFPEKDKLFIDQFIMRGGRVLWCIDPVFVPVDSLARGHSTLAFEKELNLRDQLFRYGVRINPDLLQDVVCLEYPINTAPAGQATKFVPAPFYYSPLALPHPENPVSRNLNNVMTEFVSSLESVGENPEVKAFPVLTTSPYSRRIITPVEVSLLTATTPPDSRLFNQGMIPIGMAMEGIFPSVFQNRMTGSMGLNPEKLLPQSQATKMIVITDGSILTNKVRMRGDQINVQTLGYDPYSGQVFGNRDFILNCIDYLNDDTGIMQLRSRTVKMRLLDKAKIRDQKQPIRFINLGLPLLFLLLFGLVFHTFRKKTYQKKRA